MSTQLNNPKDKTSQEEKQIIEEILQEVKIIPQIDTMQDFIKSLGLPENFDLKQQFSMPSPMTYGDILLTMQGGKFWEVYFPALFVSTVDTTKIKEIESAKIATLNAIPAGAAFDTIRNSAAILFDKQIRAASTGENNAQKLGNASMGKKTRKVSTEGGRLNWLTLSDSPFVVMHKINDSWYLSTLGANLQNGKLPKDTPKVTPENAAHVYTFRAIGGKFETSKTMKDTPQQLDMVHVSGLPRFEYTGHEQNPKSTPSGLNIDIQRMIRGDSMKDTFHVNGWQNISLPIFDTLPDMLKESPDYTKTE